ncbi:uncharacterized protein LOC144440647 [Glandiceps talaboti]
MSLPNQWRHVSTSQNPADLATRSVPAQRLTSTTWLKGPDFLWQPDDDPPSATPLDSHQYNYQINEEDPEVRKQPRVLTTAITKPKHRQPDNLGSERFQRFSLWLSLKRAVANIINRILLHKTNNKEEKEKRAADKQSTLNTLLQAEIVILRTVQKEAFPEELKVLSNPESPDNNSVKKQSPLYHLNAFIDQDGLIRVGGRLRQADLDLCGRHPIVLPKNNHISRLIIEHVHQEVQHQGRQITLAATRAKGYWVIGLHDLVRTVLHQCTTCRKLRARPLTQLMAVLPTDRLENTPPFTNVGIDVFGPWSVVTRKTRGGSSNAKRWAVIFVCLYTTAVHTEAIDSMDTSAFINALRRFIAIRGTIKKLRCDQGTNFIKERTQFSHQ